MKEKEATWQTLRALVKERKRVHKRNMWAKGIITGACLTYVILTLIGTYLVK